MPDLHPGDLVILKHAPASLLRGLPDEDQIAIRAVIGKPVIFAGFTYGQAEIEFKDDEGDTHTIWVETNMITPVGRTHAY